MADMKNIINVQLLKDQSLAQSDNMNDVMIVTTDRSFLNSNNRYAQYADISEVAADFGSNNVVTQFAQISFAAQPNPISGDGKLIIGYWRSSSENVAATAGYLLGSQINALDVIAQLQQVSAGALTITIDANPALVLTGINFSSIATISDAITILQALIATATLTYTNQQIKITSNTTGALSAVSYATGTGVDFVGSLLGLASGSGAASIIGVAAATLTAETETAALDALNALVNFKGFTFIDSSTDLERYNIALWAQANLALGYDVFSNPDNLTRVIADSPAWKIKLAGLTNYRMIYSPANNRMLGTAYMSRVHVVNFGAQNTVLTMNLKQLNGVAPENFSQGDITSANIVGLDLYTTIKNVPVVLCSSGNDFVDNSYNLMAYIAQVQVDAFNLLRGTATKIPQTTLGVTQLVNTVKQTTDRFVNAGAFAPGTWTSPTFFGVLDAFLRNIEQTGYYVLAQLLSQQSAIDRQLRKSPAIQVAVKNSGAIHSANILIYFNY